MLRGWRGMGGVEVLGVLRGWQGTGGVEVLGVLRGWRGIGVLRCWRGVGGVGEVLGVLRGWRGVEGVGFTKMLRVIELGVHRILTSIFVFTETIYSSHIKSATQPLFTKTANYTM